MKPSEWFRDIIEPTIAEFENEPDSVRRAYAACVFTYHFADAAATHTGRNNNEIATDLGSAFGLIRDVANLSKHLVLDPDRPGNKGRPLPKIEDTDVGPQGFASGLRWKSGHGWKGGKRVVWIKDGDGRFHDLSIRVREARRAIEEYLQRPDMQ